MLSDTELTFVVQGPVSLLTPLTLSNIKKHFPESKVILSTWKGLKTEGLYYHELVTSDDPGAPFLYYREGPSNNNNRQIVSTFNGLKKVKTKYAVKTRADSIFTSNRLLGILDERNKFPVGKGAFFKERVVCLSNLSVNPHRVHKMPFHPSDFFYAGLTEDLVDLFDIPLATEEEMRWFESHEMPAHSSFKSHLSRYTNEQYILVSFLKKKGFPIRFENLFDISGKNKQESEKIIVENFYIKSTFSVGVNNLKYPIKWYTSSDYAYTELEWKKLYNNYVEEVFSASLDFERLKAIGVDTLKKFLNFLSVKLYKKIKTGVMKIDK